MIKEIKSSDNNQWLEQRKKAVGASEIGIILGYSNFSTPTKLWKEKTGKIKSDFKDNEQIKYGREAEKLIIDIFKLDHPELKIHYNKENTIYFNTDYPSIQATPDGIILKNNVIIGGVEIKTSTIRNKTMYEQWKGSNIPNSYYCQVIANMIATNANFWFLKALIRYQDGNAELKEYIITRNDKNFKKDSNFIITKCNKFMDKVNRKVSPLQETTIDLGGLL